MENDKLVLIPDFWGKTMIPAILTNIGGILPERSDVWIPSGYTNSSGGYSTRKITEIREFSGGDETRNDVLTQWNTELETRRKN